LPAILVPYPHAWRYQRQNAEYLQANGGAVILDDAKLNEQLENQVRNTISDPGRLASMRSAMKALSIPDAAQKIADLLISTGTASSLKEESYG